MYIYIYMYMYTCMYFKINVCACVCVYTHEDVKRFERGLPRHGTACTQAALESSPDLSKLTSSVSNSMSKHVDAQSNGSSLYNSGSSNLNLNANGGGLLALARAAEARVCIRVIYIYIYIYIYTHTYIYVWCFEYFYLYDVCMYWCMYIHTYTNARNIECTYTKFPLIYMYV
jgi:hypothetical protein